MLFRSDKVVYVPYYMPQTHPKYQWDDQAFLQETISYLKRIRSDFNEDWILATKVTRYAYSQTVCEPNFMDRLPAMKSDINGLFIADTAYYYPEDRSIAESVQVGKQLAEAACE